MTRNQYLQDQAERAERLATLALDPLTIDRLNGFAAECRQALENCDATRAEFSPVGLPNRTDHIGVSVKHR
jgi:hypothetical protein